MENLNKKPLFLAFALNHILNSNTYNNRSRAVGGVFQGGILEYNEPAEQFHAARKRNGLQVPTLIGDVHLSRPLIDVSDCSLAGRVDAGSFRMYRLLVSIS